MEALVSFGAALVALRLAAELGRRWRVRHAPELLAWAASLTAYAAAAAGMAWGAAGGWNEASFRIYYLGGALLTAPLLGAGSLLLTGVRAAKPAAIAYVGLAVGVALAMPVRGGFTESGIPEAQAHLDLFPARILAIVGNTAGTLAVVVVALLSIRRRPLGNGLILAGVATAALGSALAGLGEAETAVFVAAAAVLLYAGFVARPRRRS